MGSSCLIKSCTVKKAKIGASFHRLPWKYPSLFSTLQDVFGRGNVREVTRWSRICSVHIAQLAPLANSHETVRRLVEYYAWNASRSYRKVVEVSEKDENRVNGDGGGNGSNKIFLERSGKDEMVNGESGGVGNGNTILLEYSRRDEIVNGDGGNGSNKIFLEHSGKDRTVNDNDDGGGVGVVRNVHSKSFKGTDEVSGKDKTMKDDMLLLKLAEKDKTVKYNDGEDGVGVVGDEKEERVRRIGGGGVGDEEKEGEFEKRNNHANGGGVVVVGGSSGFLDLLTEREEKEELKEFVNERNNKKDGITSDCDFVDLLTEIREGKTGRGKEFVGNKNKKDICDTDVGNDLSVLFTEKKRKEEIDQKNMDMIKDNYNYLYARYRLLNSVGRKEVVSEKDAIIDDDDIDVLGGGESCKVMMINKEMERPPRKEERERVEGKEERQERKDTTLNKTTNSTKSNTITNKITTKTNNTNNVLNNWTLHGVAREVPLVTKSNVNVVMMNGNFLLRDDVYFEEQLMRRKVEDERRMDEEKQRMAEKKHRMKKKDEIEKQRMKKEEEGEQRKSKENEELGGEISVEISTISTTNTSSSSSLSSSSSSSSSSSTTPNHWRRSSRSGEGVGGGKGLVRSGQGSSDQFLLQIIPAGSLANVQDPKAVLTLNYYPGLRRVSAVYSCREGGWPGDHSMIPDDCAAGAMDTARDPDVCVEENGKPKKTGCGEEQDINDNHTKPDDKTNTNKNGCASAMTNGEVAGENNNKEISEEEREGGKSTAEGDKKKNNSNKKEEGEEEEGEVGVEEEEEEEKKKEKDKEVVEEQQQEKQHQQEEEEEEEAGEEESKMEVEESTGEDRVRVDMDGSEEDEDKDSSEDDEDKLVISEGNEKAGEEESTDDNSKGEPSTAETPPVPQKPPTAPTTAPSSRSPTPKRPAEEEDGAGAGLASKRSRPLEELVCLDGLSTVSQVEGSLGQVKRDLEAVEFLIKQKEEEWNTLLRLQKRKEELYDRLARRRQVLLMKGGGSTGEEAEGSGKEGGEEEGAEGGASSNLLFLPQGGYSTLGGSQLPLMMMSQLISGSASPQSLQQMPQVLTKEGGSDGSGGNISVIDIHTSTNKPGSDPPKVSMTSEAQSKLSKQLTSGLASMKPILPKPTGSMGSGMAGLPTSLSFTATGHGPQGPTVNVQHLIAAHRKENPNTPPIRRATRGAWRHRYDGDKRAGRELERPPSVSSSSSEADTRPVPSGGQGTKGFLPMNDPSVSYKDVLLRFAELTQIEKQPGSPQISIFPVGCGEGVGKRGGGEGSRESTPSVVRDHTPPSHHPSPAPPTSKAGLEAPSALAKLLLESRAVSSAGNLVKSVGDPSAVVANSQYLTLSALLSGSSTTTVKDKTSHSQSESRGKKGNQGSDEPGSGNPKCQGCHKQRAQFVCAGCGNQWYCSRECQVAAWEEHSEHCNN
ncbi:hypothetical protein Pmani_033826 [Petrolisthes manimaculis]|uniref:MYND-type domain-containing protein n=1 Tax=Petrolisthes manimaculis TaxID=1843537 RepID=A0AAE1TQB1_9EUCA|nr:hypothetical protein Pmani_033826 [Petrolisthes manimaculis]